MLSLKSFQTKVTLILILSMVFICSLNDMIVYRYSINAQFNDIREKLMIIVQTSTLIIDAETLKKVPLNPEGINSTYFKNTSNLLQKIKNANPLIKYIYTMKRTDKKGIWQFIVDIDAETQNKSPQSLSSLPGQTYDAYRFPEMMKAYDEPSADQKLEIDEWGTSLSAYAPIRDNNGQTIAILGADIMADNIYNMQKEIRFRALLVLLLGIIVSILIGIVLSKQISGRIKELVNGARNIGGGNLQYKMDIKGRDEISELAESFNTMTSSLYQSRKNLIDYFYRVVQSFVLILEAKDPYTRGHSERVSEYSGKIAAKLGMSKEKIKMIMETTLLHDIGKLGIHENILNKNGKLTEEEWETVRQHPIVGEEILKPILLSEEMLSIIRGHHERHDGKGYPDKLSSENINIFTAIGSVADAYDAMTSARAYRPSLGRIKATEELIKNKGTQFDPKVVEAFIEILKEEADA